MDILGTYYIQNIFTEVIQTPKFWVSLILTFSACLLITIILYRYMMLYRPTLIDLLQKYRNQKIINLKKSPEELKKITVVSPKAPDDEVNSDTTVETSKNLLGKSFEDLVINRKLPNYDKI